MRYSNWQDILVSKIFYLVTTTIIPLLEAPEDSTHPLPLELLCSSEIGQIGSSLNSPPNLWASPQRSHLAPRLLPLATECKPWPKTAFLLVDIRDLSPKEMITGP